VLGTLSANGNPVTAAAVTTAIFEPLTCLYGLACAFPQSSRSPTGFPQRFSGRIWGNNTPKLFNKTGHYSHARLWLFVKPPKADIRRRDCDFRFVPKADIEPFIRSPCRRAARLLREGDAERFEIEDH
jgi:hypothetical protein